MTEQYGRLTLIKKTEKRTADHHIIGLWKCECGNEKEITMSRVRNGYTRSCGCLINEHPHGFKHGYHGTVEYKIWNGMKTRSNNPNSKDFQRYGHYEKDDVLIDFLVFYNEVGPRPSTRHSIDRVDNTKGYVRGNLRWATNSEQQRNRLDSNRVWIKGILFECAHEAAVYFGVTDTTVSRWLRGHYDDRRGTMTMPRAWAWKERKYV